MASLASIATGNWTAAGTWGLCDATSALNSVANNTALTTSYVTSSTFTPGAITIDAILVRVASRASSPSGTMSVALDNTGATVAGTEVTINVSDITLGDAATSGGCGWYCFKFAAPVTLAGATAYSVKAKTSSGSQVNLYRNATSNNWSRQLRTTTTQAPAAGDDLYMCGEFTAATTLASFTITMNETATTAYGHRYISKGATLSVQTTASTNYNCYGKDLKVFPAATLTAVPDSTSTVTFQFNSTSSGEFGLAIHTNSTVTCTGATKNVKTLLTADEAAGQTVIGPLVSTSGWAVSDELAFPSTTRTVGDCEKKTILTVDSATQVTLTAGLTSAHGGNATTGVQAEIGNLTRSVKFIGASATNTFYISVYAATVDWDYVEVYFLAGTLSEQLGLNIVPTLSLNNSYSISIRYSSIHDGHTSNTGSVLLNPTGVNIIEISNNVIYNIAGAGINISSGGAGITVNDNLIIRSTSAQGINCGISNAVVTNNKCVGNNSGGITMTASGQSFTGTFSGNTCHSNSQYGINFASSVRLDGGATLSNLTCWRNNTYGIIIAALSTSVITNCIFDTATIFGNTTGGLQLFNAGTGYLEFKDFTVNAGATLTQPIGFDFSSLNFDQIVLNHCSFGAGSTHATADLSIGSICYVALQFYNTTLASSTEVSGQTNFPGYGVMYHGISSLQHDGSAGSMKSWQRYGTVTTDTSIFNTASPSIRVTPNNASNKQQFASKFIPVASGGTATITAYVRKSVVGDGTAYNGNQPRLMVRKNLLAGITSDTVIATADNTFNGAFMPLTGTSAAVSADCVLEFYIDCDGTQGWINIDDFTTTSTLDSTDTKYWIYGTPNLGTMASSSGPTTTPGFPYC